MYQTNNTLSPERISFPMTVENDPEELAERLRKTLYYGKPPSTDRPSLPLTGLAVDYFQEAAPKELGKLDTYFASSASRSACMSPSSVMAGMLYTKRLRRKNPSYLQQVSSSDLFLISMMMASKFMYDEGVNEEVFNDEWAEAGNMDTEDVNQLEREFLSAIDWELFVKPEEFSEILHALEKRIAFQQGVDRGWFSYTDLWVLSHDAKLLPWSELTADLSKVIAVSSLAYFAGILAMIGSTILATTLSTNLVSLGSSLVLSSVKFPVSMPALPDIEANLPTSESSSPFMETDTISMKSSLTIGAMNSEAAVDGHEVNDSKKTRVTEAVEQDRPRTALNSLLPPLLALVSLKDSFLNYVYALKDRGSIKYTEGRHSEPNLDEICSAGPCREETWPHCWNTTEHTDLSHDFTGIGCNELDWPEEKDYRFQPCMELRKVCQNCYVNMKRACPVANQFHENCATQKGTVHCCCNAKAYKPLPAVVDWFNPTLSELSAIGFMLDPVSPVFVTT